MFTRWGAFVYRFRRPVALLARRRRRRRRSPRDARRRRRSARAAGSTHVGVGGRVGPPRHRVRGRQERGHRPLPVRRSPAPTRRRPTSRTRSPRAVAGLTDDPRVTGVVGYAETGDPRFISNAGDAAYVVIQLDLTDEESVAAVDDIRAAIAPPAGLQLPADRLRPDHQGLGGPVRGGPPEGRDRLAADRRARPDPGLRLGRRGRHAAVRRRPGDPEQPRAHLPRRPAGRDEHLRAQHRDDARARPGDRLLAVHRQPVPRGAAPRPDRRRGRRARDRARPARPSRSAASPSRSACRACCSSRRPAIRSIGIAGALVVLCSVVFALTFLPAVLGMLGPRVNALSLGGLVRRFRPVCRPPGRRRAHRAGSASPTA